MTKNDHFSLIFRKQVKHLTNSVMTLAFHHLNVSAIFCEVYHLKNIAIVAGFNSWGTLYFTEMIHTEVVGNTHSPGKELSFFCVTAAADCVDDFDENVLKNVFSQVLVFHKKQNRGVHFVFVANNEGFKGMQVPILEILDEFVIGFRT